eukprot:scaffold117577_cov51-Phaeocystis_antarctica.AAC.1
MQRAAVFVDIGVAAVLESTVGQAEVAAAELEGRLEGDPSDLQLGCSLAHVEERAVGRVGLYAREAGLAGEADLARVGTTVEDDTDVAAVTVRGLGLGAVVGEDPGAEVDRHRVATLRGGPHDRDGGVERAHPPRPTGHPAVAGGTNHGGINHVRGGGRRRRGRRR